MNTFQQNICAVLIRIAMIVCSSYAISAQTDTSAASNSHQRAEQRPALTELSQRGRVTFGIKGGYTHASIYGDEIEYIFANKQVIWLPSFHAGVFVNSEISEYCWLKHEFLFNKRGAGVNVYDSVHGIYPSQMQVYYLDLYPMSLTFHWKGLQIYAGPYLSALLAATLERKNDTGNLKPDESLFGDADNDESGSKYLQKFDAGVVAGIEYELPCGVLLGVRYMHGLIDVFQFANSHTFNSPKTDDIRIFNHALLVSMGCRF